MATHVAPIVVDLEPIANSTTSLPIFTGDDDNSNSHALALASPLDNFDKEEDDVNMFFNFDYEDEALVSSASTKKRRLEEGDKFSSFYTYF